MYHWRNSQPCNSQFLTRDSSVSIWAGRTAFNSWQGQWWDIFHFSTPSRLALGPTQPCNGHRGSYPGNKAAGMWSWPLTSIQCRRQECMELYLHYPLHLHGVVLN